MHLDRAGAVGLVQELVKQVGGVNAVEIAVCPPNVYLDPVAEIVKGTCVGLGAQNVYYEHNGAFTGEISAAMLADVGCKYVILGHSERRRSMGETNEEVCRKVHVALAVGLVPIVCVGETSKERDDGKKFHIVREQIYGSLAGVTTEQAERLVIAYEPVWAIGTGVTPTPQEAEEIHADVRNTLESRFSPALAARLRIQYGGSVKAGNAKDLLAEENIDGALVGGASLKASDFVPIIEAARA